MCLCVCVYILAHRTFLSIFNFRRVTTKQILKRKSSDRAEWPTSNSVAEAFFVHGALYSDSNSILFIFFCIINKTTLFDFITSTIFTSYSLLFCVSFSSLSISSLTIFLFSSLPFFRPFLLTLMHLFHQSILELKSTILATDTVQHCTVRYTHSSIPHFFTHHNSV